MTDTTTAPDRQHLVSVVTAAVLDVVECEPADVTTEARLFDELGLDSSGVFELLMKLEEALGFEFDTDNLQMQHFASVTSLVTFIQSEMA